MPNIDWNEVLKHGLTILLTGSIAGGGAFIDRSSIEEIYQTKIVALARMVNLHANDCRD